MTTFNVVRYADGRTIYNGKNPSYPPTNPKLGLDGNTVYWSERTHVATVVVPRQQDEYFSQTSMKQTPRQFQTSPTTTKTAPYISASGDLYGRSAPPALERGKTQTAVSRYSTATNVVPYIPAPAGGPISNIPNQTASSVRYPNQYKPTYNVPFRY